MAQRPLTPDQHRRLVYLIAERAGILTPLDRQTLLDEAGHASAEGALILEDEQGQPRPYPAARLAMLLRALPLTLRGVLLDACYSETLAGALLGAGVPFVVDMAGAVPDAAARAFAAGFYRALGYGQTLQTAVEWGRYELEGASPGDGPLVRLAHASEVDPATFRLG